MCGNLGRATSRFFPKALWLWASSMNRVLYEDGKHEEPKDKQISSHCISFTDENYKNCPEQLSEWTMITLLLQSTYSVHEPLRSQVDFPHYEWERERRRCVQFYVNKTGCSAMRLYGLRFKNTFSIYCTLLLLLYAPPFWNAPIFTKLIVLRSEACSDWPVIQCIVIGRIPQVWDGN